MLHQELVAAWLGSVVVTYILVFCICHYEHYVVNKVFIVAYTVLVCIIRACVTVVAQ